MAPRPEHRPLSSRSLVNKVPLEIPKDEGERAIRSLQTFIKFPTVSATAPETGAYRDCAAYIVQELQSLNVLSDIHYLPESPDHSPVVVACWKGTDKTLSVILLNSHYDVVPANPHDWTVPPFEGIRKDGNIYGRGTQDMKCVCIQYIQALRKLASLQYTPTRSIYLTFVPDEEVGGAGMAAFLESKLYKHDLPGIALALDEGLASTTNTFSVFYGERLPWWVNVTATGPTGHGSRFIDHTAVEQLVELANKALAFRKGQRDLLFQQESHENCAHAVAAKNKTLGDVTSLNITTLQAGVQVGNTFAYNCVPPTAMCSLDIRIAPHVPPSDISNMLDQWCHECSRSNNANDDDGRSSTLQWEYIQGGNDLQQHATTSTCPKVNPWYKVFSDTLQSMGMDIRPQVFPAATDSRFLRALGIRALGFSPMRNTEILLHENDEYIPESTFLEGISVYVNVIQALASQPKELDEAIQVD